MPERRGQIRLQQGPVGPEGRRKAQDTLGKSFFPDNFLQPPGGQGMPDSLGQDGSRRIEVTAVNFTEKHDRRLHTFPSSARDLPGRCPPPSGRCMSG